MEEGNLISNKYRETNTDIYSKIIETKDEVEKIKNSKQNFLSYIHCNGCFRKCSLSNSNCGRGQNIKNQFM